MNTTVQKTADRQQTKTDKNQRFSHLSALTWTLPIMLTQTPPPAEVSGGFYVHGSRRPPEWRPQWCSTAPDDAGIKIKHTFSWFYVSLVTQKNISYLENVITHTRVTFLIMAVLLLMHQS